MRTPLGSLLLATCLALAGCQTSGKLGRLGKTTSRPGGGSPDFVGVPDAPKDADAPPAGSGASTASAPKLRKGTLAGSVQDAYNRLKPGALIHLVEVGAKDAKAPLQVLANKAGCFEVQNLTYGKRYELRAEVRDGNRLLTGKTTAVVPSPRVAIYLLQEEPVGGAAATTPPPSTPGAGEAPGAAIGRPAPDEGAAPGTTPSSAIPPPEGPPKIVTGDPSLLAETRPKDKPGELPMVPPTVTIPGPGRSHTPEKPVTPPPSVPAPPRSAHDDLAPSAAPSASPGEAPSAAPARPAPKTTARLVVPSCVRVGNTVESFALYDKDGVAREYRAPFEQKLILLDFWFGGCAPCRRAIPKLNELHRKYAGYKVEIVGVSCEPYTTTLAEKKAALAKAVRDYGLRIDYTELLSGGGKGDCPLVKQMLDGEGFPTMVLLDKNGRVIGKFHGGDEATLTRVDRAIYKALGLPQAARP